MKNVLPTAVRVSVLGFRAMGNPLESIRCLGKASLNITQGHDRSLLPSSNNNNNNNNNNSSSSINNNNNNNSNSNNNNANNNNPPPPFVYKGVPGVETKDLMFQYLMIQYKSLMIQSLMIQYNIIQDQTEEIFLYCIIHWP